MKATEFREIFNGRIRHKYLHSKEVMREEEEDSRIQKITPPIPISDLKEYATLYSKVAFRRSEIICLDKPDTIERDKYLRDFIDERVKNEIRILEDKIRSHIMMSSEKVSEYVIEYKGKVNYIGPSLIHFFDYGNGYLHLSKDSSTLFCRMESYIKLVPDREGGITSIKKTKKRWWKL